VLDGSVNHPLAEDVEAELRFAGDDVGLVVDRSLLTHELPLVPRLELQRVGLGHGQLAGRGGERSVAQTPIASLMNHLVVPGDALGGGHVPLRRGRADEHHLRGRSCLPEGRVEVTDRAGSVRVLIAVLRVADALLDPDARPVDVQLVGRHHRQRGPDARSHLGSVGDDEHGAVGLDAQIDARPQDGGIRACRSRGRLRPGGVGEHPRRQHERTRREHPADELAPADVFDDAHARSFAAVLIAALIR
jgi:hypothetical protein